jgi:rSAM/selenodomain-associated transferase 1
MGIVTKKALLVFQKNAVRGKVKTRLAASVGEERAFQVYQELLSVTYWEVAQLDGIDVVPFFSEYPEPLPFLLENSPCYQIQSGADLGERMSNAFAWAFSQGYGWVGIIGTDCPELRHETIGKGLGQLKDFDFSIGPAHDGGYYFLAMREFHPWIFENIAWSSSTVLGETIELVENRNMGYSLLEILRDIDTEADYLSFLAKKRT